MIHACGSRRPREALRDLPVHDAHRGLRFTGASGWLVGTRGEMDDRRRAAQRVVQRAVVDFHEVADRHELRARDGRGIERAYEPADAPAGRRQVRDAGAADETVGAGDDDRRVVGHQNHFQPCRR